MQYDTSKLFLGFLSDYIAGGNSTKPGFSIMDGNSPPESMVRISCTDNCATIYFLTALELKNGNIMASASLEGISVGIFTFDKSMNMKSFLIPGELNTGAPLIQKLHEQELTGYVYALIGSK